MKRLRKIKKRTKEQVKLQLLQIAKKNCKKCQGLGYIGTNIKTGKIVACECAFKKIEQYRINKMVKNKEVEK